MTLTQAGDLLPWFVAFLGFFLLLVILCGVGGRVEALTGAVKANTRAVIAQGRRIDAGYFNIESILDAARKIRTRDQQPDSEAP